MRTAISRDSAARDGDGAARSKVTTTTDAGSLLTSSSRDSAARDGDGAAISIATTTDAGSISSSSSRDVAALNLDVSTGYLVVSFESSSYAGTIAVAAGRELACACGSALDGERTAIRDINARIILIESPHGVLRVVLQDDGGIAHAGDASII